MTLHERLDKAGGVYRAIDTVFLRRSHIPHDNMILKKARDAAEDTYETLRVILDWYRDNGYDWDKEMDDAMSTHFKLTFPEGWPS